MAKQQKKSSDLFEQYEDSFINRLMLVAVAYIGFGMAFYHFIEKFTWVDSFYFVIISLSTIGYGDIVPKTDLGKIFTSFYVFFGIVLFVFFARALLMRLVRFQQRRKKR